MQLVGRKALSKYKILRVPSYGFCRFLAASRDSEMYCCAFEWAVPGALGTQRGSVQPWPSVLTRLGHHSHLTCTAQEGVSGWEPQAVMLPFQIGPGNWRNHLRGGFDYGNLIRRWPWVGGWAYPLICGECHRMEGKPIQQPLQAWTWRHQTQDSML